MGKVMPEMVETKELGDKEVAETPGAKAVAKDLEVKEVVILEDLSVDQIRDLSVDQIKDSVDNQAKALLADNQVKDLSVGNQVKALLAVNHQALLLIKDLLHQAAPLILEILHQQAVLLVLVTRRHHRPLQMTVVLDPAVQVVVKQV